MVHCVWMFLDIVLLLNSNNTSISTFYNVASLSPSPISNMYRIFFTVIYINVYTLKNCAMYFIYCNMYRMPRKVRLSVYRKNQYRKTSSNTLLVSIPRELVIIHAVSLPINAYLDASLSSLSSLKQRIEHQTSFLSPSTKI
jgi:hypothetical protein